MKIFFRNHLVAFPIHALPLVLLLSACDNPAPGEGMPKPLAEESSPEVVPAVEALHSPDLTTLDPGALNQAEINKVLSSGPRCSFAYTAESPPVLAAKPLPDARLAKGVVKLHGRLVEVTAHSLQDLKSLARGATLTADGFRVTVKPESGGSGERRVANMEFELEQGLLVGYRGWYSCSEREQIERG